MLSRLGVLCLWGSKGKNGVPKVLRKWAGQQPRRSVSTGSGAAANAAAQGERMVDPKTVRKISAVGLSIFGFGTAYWALSKPRKMEFETMTFTNWSGTHEVTTHKFLQPENERELEIMLGACHRGGSKIRVVGSALSPNGIAFSSKGMISLALMDRVLHVDKETGQVRVQCGARVQEVVEALRPYGLTLQNYASIREQQIGGFIQVGAHGTGAQIPPVDEQVVKMKLVTPSEGTIELSKDDKDPTLFNLARVGLGCFGIVSEVTLQCVPAHQLLEKTFVASAKEVKKNHSKWLAENKHMRYMWIPYTDKIVVVQCNPHDPAAPPPSESKFTPVMQTEPLRQLLTEKAVDGKIGEHDMEQLKNLTFTELRDLLLKEDPLNVVWIKRVNRAEAEFWQRSAGYRVGWSDEILGFDCGGQQWVLEVAFPAGTITQNSGADLKYMDELLKEIEYGRIPAHTPIEQRWTSSSASDLSPAFSASRDDLHSWIGIIMYLPTEDPTERKSITDSFMQYSKMCERRLMPKYKATCHWAKLEIPDSPEEVSKLQAAMAKRFPVAKVQEYRKKLDPKNILGNKIVDTVFPIEQ